MILESVVSCLLFISYFTIKAGFLSQVETGLLLPFEIGSLALIACLMSLVLVSPHANFSVNAVSSLHTYIQELMQKGEWSILKELRQSQTGLLWSRPLTL